MRGLLVQCICPYSDFCAFFGWQFMLTFNFNFNSSQAIIRKVKKISSCRTLQFRLHHNEYVNFLSLLKTKSWPRYLWIQVCQRVWSPAHIMMSRCPASPAHSALTRRHNWVQKVSSTRMLLFLEIITLTFNFRKLCSVVHNLSVPDC